MLNRIQRLKLELLAHGVSMTPEARSLLSGGRGERPVTLADYASTSGIALELDRDIWVNAPIRDFNPNFVRDSVYRLISRDGEFFVWGPDVEVPARPVPVPAYAVVRDADGVPYSRYGLTHTDRIRISPIEGCIGRCRFCDLAVTFSYRKKDIERLIETIRLALQDPVLPARHIMISGGTPRPEDYDYLNDVYERVVSAFPDVPIDIMMLPLPGLLDFQRLRDMGVNGLALNLEIFDERIARELMPLKGSFSRAYWLDVIEEAVSVFGPGRVRSLLMVGLEPVESTVAGVRALAERGCEPVLSPFRPHPATALADRLPPSVRTMAEAFLRSAEVSARFDVKLGPRCIPCQHNTISFPDDSGYYVYGGRYV